MSTHNSEPNYINKLDESIPLEGLRKNGYFVEGIVMKDDERFDLAVESNGIINDIEGGRNVERPWGKVLPRDRNQEDLYIRYLKTAFPFTMSLHGPNKKKYSLCIVENEHTAWKFGVTG